MREYRLKNLDKLRTYKREYNRAWRKMKGYHNEIKWKMAHPDRVLAQKVLRDAVRRGIVLKKPCEICNDNASVAHHPDYSEPLAVKWLCKACHRKEHYGT